MLDAPRKPVTIGILRAAEMPTPRRRSQSDHAPPSMTPIVAATYGSDVAAPALSEVSPRCCTRYVGNQVSRKYSDDITANLPSPSAHTCRSRRSRAICARVTCSRGAISVSAPPAVINSSSSALARLLCRGSRYTSSHTIALRMPATPVTQKTDRQPVLTAIQKSRGESSAEPTYCPDAYVDVARPRSRCGNQVETTRLLTGNAGASARPTAKRSPNSAANPLTTPSPSVESDQPSCAMP